jgi:hypothetical protein
MILVTLPGPGIIDLESFPSHAIGWQRPSGVTLIGVVPDSPP